jgi:hypothetical protein
MAPSGSFLTVWSALRDTGPDTSGYGVWAQLHAADGSRLGGEVHVNTYSFGDQFLGDCKARPDGSFVVAWTSDGSNGSDNQGTSIQVQRLAADGAKLGAETQANVQTSGTQTNPVIAAGAGQRFVVLWENEILNPNGAAVTVALKARIFED